MVACALRSCAPYSTVNLSAWKILDSYMRVKHQMTPIGANELENNTINQTAMHVPTDHQHLLGLSSRICYS